MIVLLSKFLKEYTARFNPERKKLEPSWYEKPNSSNSWFSYRWLLVLTLVSLSDSQLGFALKYLLIENETIS